MHATYLNLLLLHAEINWNIAFAFAEILMGCAGTAWNGTQNSIRAKFEPTLARVLILKRNHCQGGGAEVVCHRICHLFTSFLMDDYDIEVWLPDLTRRKEIDQGPGNALDNGGKNIWKSGQKMVENQLNLIKNDTRVENYFAENAEEVKWKLCKWFK